MFVFNDCLNWVGSSSATDNDIVLAFVEGFGKKSSLVVQRRFFATGQPQHKVTPGPTEEL